MPRTNTFRALLDLKLLEEVAIHPDGRLTAVTVSDNFTRRGEGRQARIWVVEEGGPARQLTNGPGADRLPRWSPDGSALAFVSDRASPGMPVLFLWTEAGGERRIPAAIDGAVEDLQWNPNGSRLLVLAADAGSDRAGTQAATRIEAGGDEGDPTVQRPHSAWRRTYLVDVPGGETQELARPGHTTWECHWSGAARIAAITAPDPTESGWYDVSLDVVNAETGDARPVYQPHGQLQNPRISPDGRRIAAIEAIVSDRGTLAGPSLVVNVETGVVTHIDGLDDVAFLEWRDDASLWFAAWRGLGTCFGTVDLDGAVAEIWAGDATIGSRYTLRISATPDGNRIAAVIEDPTNPPEVAFFEGGEWRRISAFNAGIAALRLPRAERVAWPARDGLEIEGLLVRPNDPSPGALPLITIVHGGPNLLWSHQFTNNTRALAFAAEGYAVLLPNPRGSIGRGVAFAEAVLRDFGGEDLQDILRGVEALVERGVVATERVGITGVSYGGFMAAWAVTQTDRFAASIPLSGISDQISHYYSSNIRRFDEIFVGAGPREDPEAYLARSPVQFVEGVRTPTLLISGDGDHITPPGQAIEFYQALVEIGCETKLVIYPREGHYVLEWEHQLDFFDRVLGWFDCWLGVT